MRPWMAAAVFLIARAAHAAPTAGPVELARDGIARYAIRISPAASETERLAAAELAKYLRAISGARFPVSAFERTGRAILIRVAPRADFTGDAYSIAVRGDTVLLSGATARASLYSVYDFLERLGCRWLAPQLLFYGGSGEQVPSRRTLTYGDGDVKERPRFAIRKLDVAEGLSHDSASLSQIVEWMPKVRFNTLQLPSNFGGSGRVTWDAWRGAQTPELARRGLTIEVGGHGYQNFISAAMEGGRLFETNPDWFGNGKDCKPSRARDVAFNTTDPDAVAYFVANVLAYLHRRPEIRIFDLWPPDGVKWSECGDSAAYTPPEERQATLVRTVRDALIREGTGVRLEMIAYARTIAPPSGVRIPGDVLVDFCPIEQNFDAQIDDPTAGNNARYVDLLRAWRRTFTGDIGLYSYFRRYAWISLPVVLPRYMAHDLKWYASVPLQGVSTYAEPGDWFTYEVNHYALARLAWNPDADMDALLDDYTAARYGSASSVARAALNSLEDIVRVYGSVQHSTLKRAADIAAARDRLASSAAAVAGAATHPLPVDVFAALERLALMLDFAIRDLEIQYARASGESDELVAARIDPLVTFLENHRHRGVFLLTGRNDHARTRRHYRLPP